MADLPLLDGRQLQLIDLLHSTGSVTRTAEAMGQTQPTVSIWLARLRTQMGDPLFVRTAQGMQPTPRTEALIGTVRTVLAGLRAMAETPAAFDPATMQRRFRIFMTDASHITLLPRLFSHVRALAPGVTLEAAAIHAGMAAELEAGTADLALGLIPALEAGFYQQTLFDQDWVCLAHPDHPRIRPRSFGLKDYSREAHAGIVSGTGAQLLDSTVRRLGIERRVVLGIPGFLGLPAILSTTDLVATLPRHIGETLAQMGGLRVLRCPVPIPGFSVRQHWHARFHQDAGNRWLRGICAELFLRTAPARTGPR
ncbi:LysR family transcriptional regulator [Pseudacidovorax intermedius]|uniref:LysR family transcriptional regulator n=1 Tax=Pseudacidovorax intermedius TaxID=433924 RepID=A0A147GM45_9BURK|nr:LysR family transcriptional regulator [Pseudacidovorax intermedius]KTT14521.1 LysR family transcriptional regulator [Pseudacidovorax intermedius]